MNKTKQNGPGRPRSFSTQQTELVSAMEIPKSTVKKVRAFAKREGIALAVAYNRMILEKN